MEYNNWLVRKEGNNEDISYYFWFCDNLIEEYEQLLDENNELNNKLEK